MKSQHLNFFLAMAEHGSIRGAARALGLTQPAVTKTVRTLEKEIGLPLIQRSISPTVSQNIFASEIYLVVLNNTDFGRSR
jgi:LysR family transcriptional regulator of abg operon